jgi:ATP synthase protein I
VAADDPGNRKQNGGDARAAAVAWTLPFSLVVPMVVGGGLGYLVDRWLHTKPWFMLVLGLLGVGLGIRDAMKTASLLDKK